MLGIVDGLSVELKLATPFTCLPMSRWYVPRKKEQHKNELYSLTYTSRMLFSPDGMDQKLSISSRLRTLKLSSPVADNEVIFVPFKILAKEREI